MANNPAFTVPCSLWSVWFQLVFGVYLFCACMAFRYLRLLLIVRFQVDLSGPWKSPVLFISLFSPAILIGIIFSAVKIDGPVADPAANVVCKFLAMGVYGSMVILAVYVIFIFAGIVWLRNVKQKFVREYRETAVGMLTFVLAYSVYIGILAKELQFYAWGRIVCTVIVTAISSFGFLWVVGYPVYQW